MPEDGDASFPARDDRRPEPDAGPPRSEAPSLCLHRPWFPEARSARAPACDQPCAERARPFVLGATVLGSSMAFIDGTVVNIALPAIQQAFDADFEVLQWVVNAYTLLLGALILTGGALGDRFGRRLIFVAGIALFAAASIACALASSATWLVAARAVQGVGGALLVPQSLAIIAASFPRADRGRAIGIWAAFAAITTASGPVLGGAFIDLLSWRAVFWINVPIAAAAVALTLGYVPESRGSAGRLDWAGSGLATVALALITYALVAIPERGAADAALFACLAAGGVLLGLFLRVEQRSKAPLVPLAMFRAPAFSAANGVTLCLYFALSALLFLLPYNLIQIRGYSGLEAGAALLPFGLTMGLFSSRAGALADRYGPRLPLTGGSLLVAASCLVLAGVELRAGAGYWSGYFPAIMLMSAGMTVCVAPLTTAVMNAAADHQSGTASGINNAVSRLAGVVAVAVAGLAATLVFSGVLAESLAAMDLPPGAGDRILAEANKLAALEVPGSVGSDTAAALNEAIEAAFLSGYRAALVIAALCAALAGGLAFVYLRDKNR